MMRSIFYQFFLLIVLNSVSAKFNVSTSCDTQCGTVAIPYPFGIGDGCYHNEWYEVSCSKSVPFLPKIKKEVVRIDIPRPIEYGRNESVPWGSLRIKARVTSMGCSDGENPDELLNFTGSPFSMSHNNTLVAFGCNSKATLTHIEPIIVGCFSTCDTGKTLLPSWEGCYGYKCCKASIPEEVGQVIGVNLESSDGNRTRGGCEMAFLTVEDNEASLPPGELFHEKKYSTVELKWEVMTTNTSFEESLNCGDISLSGSFRDFSSRPCHCYGFPMSHYDPIHLLCACTSGYEGNPYLPDGCKDDECSLSPEDRVPYHCSSGYTCRNVRGRHRCVIKKNKTVQIYIGVGVGLTVLLVGVAIWAYKRIKKQRKIELRKKFFNRNGGVLLEQQMNSGEGSVQKTTVFSSKELEEATEGFSSERVLGQGGQGTVFKGVLGDGTIVAVKKATELDEDKVEEFINEVVVLSQVNHRHVVKILGCCLETEVPLIVYEYIPNGSLFHHLHGQGLEDHSTTAWDLRLQVAIDIARALSYLHRAASAPILHKDIKSANIMLDENNRGKLADFGTSRVISLDHSHVTTVISGSFGYADPEYLQSGRFSEKSDVYSYGVVLAELVSGQKAVRLEPSGGNRSSLAKSFLLAMKEKRLSEIIDPRIRASCDLEQVTVMAKVASLCLNLKGEKRPNMRQVLMELETCSSHPELLTMEEEVAPFQTGRAESFNIDVASSSTSQYDSAIWSDVQPLNPHHT